MMLRRYHKVKEVKKEVVEDVNSTESKGSTTIRRGRKSK